MDRSSQVIIIGVDAHKSTHTFVAVDEVGRTLGQQTVKATTAGHLSALEWAAQWPQVQFALEDCRHVTRRLEADLLRRGYAVVRVKTQLMAVHRRSARQPGKSDPIDAQAVAMAALREPNLPIARLDGPAREIKLLSDHRHDLVCERTKLINRLRWHLHELDPELHVPARGLRRYCVMDELADRITEFTGVVAQIAGELLQRCRQMTRRIDDLEREIRGRVRVLAPSLLAVPGCGVLSAAVIIGETAGAHRFHSKDAYAKFNGTAPIPVWSAHERVRLNRGGNRTVNAALHAIAITQVARGGQGKDYVDKLQAAGKSRREALRLLRRRVSDRVFQVLRADESALGKVANATFSAAA
ncbi:transposase [Rhodococcus ruber]|uniref:IS110 family transposase n=1 Tax=Rhodococcus ruber TaxID=1830 RepID=UPI001D2B80C9|nr:IS110 family transposase [Rhodococcus ruber]MBP2214775.1 transposase [Rhodococcus ruber]